MSAMAIPEGWELYSVDEIANYVNGKAHEANINEQGKYVVVNSRFISTESEIKKYSDDCYCPASTGDVLMVMSDVPNGRAIAKCFYVPSDDTYTVNQRICILTPKDIDGKLLFYKLNRNQHYLAFDDGAKQTNLRKEDVLSCMVTLPVSRAEQHAIAVALTDMDALISSLNQLITKKRDIQQAAMQQLLTGQRRLPGFDEEWEVKLLGDVAELVMGQSPSSLYYNKRGDGLPLVQGNADIVDRKTIKRFFTTEITKLGKCGDLLLSVRAPVGEVARTMFDVCLGRGVCAIRGGSEFLYHYLISIESSWVRLSKGSTFDSINSAELRSLVLRLPASKAEQTAIATILSDMDAELATLEIRRDKARQLKQGMMQELLTGRIRLTNSSL